MVTPARERGVAWFYGPLENLPPLKFSSPQEEVVTKAVCEREFADLCLGATRNGAMRMAKQSVTQWFCKNEVCEIHHKELVKFHSEGLDAFKALGAVVVGGAVGGLYGGWPGAVFGATIAFSAACPDSGDSTVWTDSVFNIPDVGSYDNSHDDSLGEMAVIDAPNPPDGLIDATTDENLAEAEVAGILEDTPAGKDAPVVADTPEDIVKTPDVISTPKDALVTPDTIKVNDTVIKADTAGGDSILALDTSSPDLFAPADLPADSTADSTPVAPDDGLAPADGFAATDTAAPILLGTAFCTNEFENTCLKLNPDFVSTCLYIGDFQIKGDVDSEVTLNAFLSYKNDPISMTVSGNNVLPDTVMGGKLVCSPDPDSFEEGISGEWNCFKFGELKAVIAGTIYDGAIVMFPGSSTVGSETCESPYHSPCAQDDANMCIDSPAL